MNGTFCLMAIQNKSQISWPLYLLWWYCCYPHSFPHHISCFTLVNSYYTFTQIFLNIWNSTSVPECEYNPHLTIWEFANPLINYPSNLPVSKQQASASPYLCPWQQTSHVSMECHKVVYPDLPHGWNLPLCRLMVSGLCSTYFHLNHPNGTCMLHWSCVRPLHRGELHPI